MITSNQIQAIVAHANSYVAQHELTQGELANKVGISPAYISVMLAGKTEIGSTTIADGHWSKLARVVGMPLEVQHWGLVQTVQFKKIIRTIDQCRKRYTIKTIIGATGSGKTFVIKKYQEMNPKHTYVVTISSLVSVGDILHELLRQLGEPVEYVSKATKMWKCMAALRQIKLKGGMPIIIFDEAENMRSDTMKLLKGFYDGVEGWCSIILVGTEQLVRKIQMAKNSNKEAGPQFYRRFYPGMVLLDGIEGSFFQFFTKMGIEDKKLQTWLKKECDNYGELNKWLEPVIRDCAERGVAVSYEEFLLFHDLQRGGI